MTAELIFDFLEEKVHQYNCPDFIELDPISIPHQFTRKEDIEIAGFIAATLSWGNRKAIVKAGNQLMDLFDHQPYDFILNASTIEKERLNRFVYRTFNGYDILFFIDSLKTIYTHKGGLESAFVDGFNGDIKNALIHFRQVFMRGIDCRSGKHVANVVTGSSAKRLNMFLRWMVRNDNKGVDFGLWKTIQPSQLYLPLDLHTGNVSRKLLLLQRKQNDWMAVEEVTKTLRAMDPNDPIKYDFALFGLGISEKF